MPVAVRSSNVPQPRTLHVLSLEHAPSLWKALVSPLYRREPGAQKVKGLKGIRNQVWPFSNPKTAAANLSATWVSPHASAGCGPPQ